MTDFRKRAEENFKNGYNCAQSVCLAFAKKINLDKETLLKLTSSFGGGMGRMREVCGAVSGMFIIAGLLKGYSGANCDELKGAHYKLIQDLAEEFKKEHKTIICRELLGLEKEDEISPTPAKRTEEYYNNRPCEEFIKTAAKIIEKMLI